MSLKQTSETVSAKRWIAEFQAAGPATANARRPYELTLCRGTKPYFDSARFGREFKHTHTQVLTANQLNLGHPFAHCTISLSLHRLGAGRNFSNPP